MHYYPEDEALDLLEELLSITQEWQDMAGSDTWSRISARCADLRDGEDV